MCRFTTVQRTVPVQQVRATFQAQTQASAKNRRLAQQMANRLSVDTIPQQPKPVSVLSVRGAGEGIMSDIFLMCHELFMYACKGKMVYIVFGNSVCMYTSLLILCLIDDVSLNWYNSPLYIPHK